MPEPVTVEGLSGTTCVVTGGAGLIGSNLVRALHTAGASVRVIDLFVPEHGGDRRNLEGLTGVDVVQCDVGDPRVADVLAGAEVVFDVAGQVSHTASMRDPLVDLHHNTIARAHLLDMLRVAVPDARVVHTSTRQVYGRPIRLPIDEDHPTNPVDVNGVAKLAGEQLHMVYARAYGLATTSLRLTNVYGPRQRLTSDELGFLPVFLRRALQGDTIRIFGDGSQRRDCLHVDDVVRALVAATTPDVVGQVLNVGHHHDHSLADIAGIIVAATGRRSSVELVPWPEEHRAIDIGSVRVDGSRMVARTGWRPSIELGEGIADTVAFYGAHPWYLSST